MLLPHERLYKGIESVLLLAICAGVFTLFAPYVPLWTAGIVALIVFVASIWAGL